MRISDWSSDVCSSDLAARSSGSTNTPGKNGHGLFGFCAQNCAGLRRDHALFPALAQRPAKLQFQPRHALRNSGLRQSDRLSVRAYTAHRAYGGKRTTLAAVQMLERHDERIETTYERQYRDSCRETW